MKHYFYILIIAAVIGCSDKSSIEYLDSEIPNNTAELFSENRISKKNIKEGNGVFTPDGNTFLFIEVDTSGGLQILQSKFKNKKWSIPQKASFSNKGDNWEPFIAHDGNSVYFISNRSTAEKWNGRIWKSELSSDNVWQEPENIEIPIETKKGLWFPSVSKNGLIYFGAYLETEQNYGKSDLYSFDRSTGIIKNLKTLNSEHEEWDPFIAKDDSYLIFASDREGGFGKVDCYISFKKGDKWQAPINMGNEINTENVDVAVKVTPDEKFILFDRPSKGEQDIYWVKADIISNLKSGSD